MPLLANFIGTIASFFAGLLGRVMSFNLALKYAAWLAWGAVLLAFVTSVMVCLSAFSAGFGAALGALGTPSPSNWTGYFSVGLGMLIPQSAPAIMACLASVWIACQFVKIQKTGIEQFSK
jgi:hypothetical protein